MIEYIDHLKSQDAFMIGLISLKDGRANIGCLIWDASPHWADIHIASSDSLPDSFHIRIRSLDVDCDCDVIAREGCNLRIRLSQ